MDNCGKNQATPPVTDALNNAHREAAEICTLVDDLFQRLSDSVLGPPTPETGSAKGPSQVEAAESILVTGIRSHTDELRRSRQKLSEILNRMEI